MLFEKICIYGTGEYGIRTYQELKRHGVRIDMFGDKNPERWGYVLDDIYCKSYEDILLEDKDVLLIVAIAHPEKLIQQFKELGFNQVYDIDTALKKLTAGKGPVEDTCISDMDTLKQKQQGISKGLYHKEITTCDKDVYDIVGEYYKRKRMKVTEINYSDSNGHAFNGFDLIPFLKKAGIQASQIVLEKSTGSEDVIQVKKDMIVHNQILDLEKQYGVDGTLFPYGDEIYNLAEYKEADIVHFHILNSNFVSLFDYPKLMNGKKSIWTLHDPWLFTGNCLHPLRCEKWKVGCIGCEYEGDFSYGKSKKNMELMWKVKKQVLEQVNPDIVVSCGFMEKYIKESPMTGHFNKVHKIPFGVDVKKYDLSLKETKKRNFGLDTNKVIIGFRAEADTLKGSEYIYKALKHLNLGNEIEILKVGFEKVPEEIKRRYHVMDLGWVNDARIMGDFFEACDIFLMPSLAETFGLMAIEAMAAGCTVVCFDQTILPEITEAPECGVQVEYKSEEKLAEAILHLVQNKEEIRKRGQKGRKLVEQKYTLEEYVSRHIKLYEELCEK